MFKFFRKYNKVLLVGGGVVLMVAFLIPQAVQMFSPNPRNQSVASIHGEPVSGIEANNAAATLRLLGSLPFAAALPLDAQGRPINDEITWLMIQRDARAMGLWASDAEVDVALAAAGIDQAVMDQLAMQRGVPTVFLREAVRDWLIAERYRQLVEGVAFSDPGEMSALPALRKLEMISRFAQFAQQMGDDPQAARYLNQMYAMTMAQANGIHRLSGPMLKHFVNDNYATLEGRAIVIDAQADDAEAPDDARLREVFQRYRDALPGEGEPYPLGYMIPDRVRIEYLQLPAAEVRAQTQVGYAEVLDHYRRNKSQYADEDGEAPAQPGDDVRERIRRQLTAEAADALMQQIINYAQGLLAEDTRGLDRQGGRIALPEDFEPTPLEQIAQQVRERFGVEMRVLGDDETWGTVDTLSTLDGIGQSMLPSLQALFPQVVSSAYGLAPEDAAIPSSLRTQPGIISPPLSGYDENTYMFRLIEVQRAHPPTSLEAVREQVARDARRIAAYEKLAANLDQWRSETVAQGLESLAASRDAAVREVGPFQRYQGAAGQAPFVAGVGRSQSFIDAAFDLVEPLEPDVDISALPREERVAVTALAEQLAVSVFMLDQYNALTRSGYEQRVAGGAPLGVSFLIDGTNASDPLSRAALARRTNLRERGAEADADADGRESQSDDAKRTAAAE